jgi:hypothetical protein
MKTRSLVLLDERGSLQRRNPPYCYGDCFSMSYKKH